jgi:uncharacterized membrane protein (DUF2068 family)
VVAEELPPEWQHLEAQTTAGDVLGRCLRCDAWVGGSHQPPPTTAGLQPDAVPRRGKELRDAIVLRLVALERAVHCLVFGLAAIGLFVLRLHLSELQSEAQQLTSYRQGGFAGTAQVASQQTLVRELDRLLDLRRGTLGLLALAALVYCGLEGTEAVGLWLERRWAEYLTAIATAGFIPFEIDELASRVTVLRVATLLINLVVLVYLVWRKHLFGIGGRPPDQDRLAPLRPPSPEPSSPEPSSPAPSSAEP